MYFLRQSTAVTVSFGPALLYSDGVTLVTNLVGTGSNQTENTSTGIRISKNGGAFAARHTTAGTSTYDAFGNYLVILDTTDTNTLGAMRMQFANAAAFCPIWMDFGIVPANIWDSWFAAVYQKVDLTQVLTVGLSATSAQLGVNVVNINSQTATAAAGVTFPASIASPTNITAGTITTTTNLTNAPTVGDFTATMKAATLARVTLVDTCTTNTDVSALRPKKNTAITAFSFSMVLASDGLTPATGLTITATRMLDGSGSFTACANSAVEVGSGVYTINLAAGDMNGNVVTLKFTAMTALQTVITFVTQP